MEFSRTTEAAKADKLSKWDLIAAIAEDAVDNDVPIAGTASCVAAKAALDAAGHEHADSTVRHLCSIAKFDYESTPAQRKTWRTYGWSCVAVLAEAGWTHEAADDLLRSERRSWRQIKDAVSARSSARPPALPLPLNEAWHKWTRNMDALLTEGAHLASRAETEPVDLDAHAALGRLIYDRIVERQLDAELRQLIETNA